MEHIKRDPPSLCDVCSSKDVIYTTEKEILGTSKRIWPFLYYCRSCKALVGCHPGTNRPLGFMANAFIRRLRAELHELIDPIWKSGFATRTQIYEWIAKELYISKDFCHIAQLSPGQLQLAIKFVTAYRSNNDHHLKKARNDKQRSETNRTQPDRRHRKRKFFS